MCAGLQAALLWVSRTCIPHPSARLALGIGVKSLVKRQSKQRITYTEVPVWSPQRSPHLHSSSAGELCIGLGSATSSAEAPGNDGLSVGVLVDTEGQLHLRCSGRTESLRLLSARTSVTAGESLQEDPPTSATLLAIGEPLVIALDVDEGLLMLGCRGALLPASVSLTGPGTTRR